MKADLVIKDLRVSVEGKEILKGLNLAINKGEIHAIMGPNGSGKSTLANTLMGHPAYEVTGGEILFKGKNIVDLAPDERSRLGMFLAFQYPSSIPGVSVANFLRTAVRAHAEGSDGADNGDSVQGVSMREFRRLLKEKMEMLQMAMLQPEIAILDETDSGLDIDALRIVSEGVNRLMGPELGVLIITHYQRILNYVRPEHVHIMVDGRIVLSGGPELALELEDKGYDWIKEEVAASK
jgi:Fe-S cluster assembly ATP-binding protein